jgi:Nif-specific regulatory protein
MAPAHDETSESLRRERDLYLRLLQLTSATRIAPFLEETLALLVEVTSAEHGYVELQDAVDPDASWSAVHRLSPASLQDVKESISRGIIAKTLAMGETVVTASAVQDDRFSTFPSVKGRNIEAVLCIPIGRDAPCGVVYLQGRRGGGPFSEQDRACAETVSRHLEPVAGRLLLSHRVSADDPTAPYRKILRLDGFVGRSPAIAEVLRDVAMVARSNRTVLITGETGTGKTQLARILHLSGPRAARPFTEISMTTVNPSTAESELFGHVKGAFTGADRDRIGLFGESDGGTVFLDEIGDAPPELQQKLLQFLQSGEYRPISGPLRRADVRVIAGTRVDLERAVAEGRFRDDLLYRLNVITIRMPALRERRGDIRELAAAFCEEACRTEGGPLLSLSPGLLVALEGAEWAGNVRQLQNQIVRGVLRAMADGAVQVEHRHVFQQREAPGDPSGPVTYHDAMQRAKTKVVREALEASGWNVAEAARALDITRAHLYNLMAESGLQRPTTTPPKT